MADVKISQLTQGLPTGNNLIPYSTGSSTLAVATSAIFENVGSTINVNGKSNQSLIILTNDAALNAGGNGLRVGLDNNLNAFVNNSKAGSLSFSTTNTERMKIDSSGNIGIGTSNSKSTITVMGSERIIAADAASVYEQDRYFTFKKHYSTKGVSNGSYTRLIQFRPYLNGTTNYPTGTNFWSRVGVYIRMGGHSSQVGNGERCWTGSYDYVGNGIGSVVTLEDLQNGNIPLINVGFSGWEAFIDIKGADGGVPGGVFGGYCYIELNFGSGEGNLGEAIVWNITEYY